MAADRDMPPIRIKYSTRVVVPVALACLISLLSIGMAVRSFRRADRVRLSVEMDHAADLVLCHQLAQLLERKLAKSRTFIITGDESFALEMEDARSELLSVIGDLKGGIETDEGRAWLRQAAQLEARHHQVLRGIMAQRRAGRSARQLGPLLVDRLKPIRDDLDAAIRQLIEFKEDRLRAGKIEATANTRDAQRLSVVAGSASLIAFIVVLMVVRHFSRIQMGVEHGLRRSNAELDVLVEERTKELSAFNRELESFSYSVAHDLRTPLRAITNYSDLALAQLDERDDDRLKGRVLQIRSAGLRMSRTIDSLLTLSRLTRRPLNMREVDMSALAAEVNSTIAQANPCRSVEVAIAPDLHDTGDEDLLRVVLQNLLDNAWKFTAKGRDARIEFGRIDVDGHPAYFVRDNGAGFDPSFAHKLFLPFERLHAAEDFAGAGIGLAAVERIVHRHGGSAWAEGAPAGGAAFYFTLHHRIPGKERPARSKRDE